MALIKCYECFKEISDLAMSCPNCGAPSSLSSNEKNQELKNEEFQGSEEFPTEQQSKEEESIGKEKIRTEHEVYKRQDFIKDILDITGRKIKLHPASRRYRNFRTGSPEYLEIKNGRPMYRLNISLETLKDPKYQIEKKIRNHINQIVDDFLKKVYNKQKSFPNDWLGIVCKRKDLMQMEVMSKKQSCLDWSVIHANEYKNKTDWIEDKNSEISFRIQRFSEIMYLLESTSIKIDSFLKALGRNEREIYFDQKYPSLGDIDWWLNATRSSLNGAVIYAVDLGFTDDEILDACGGYILPKEFLRSIRPQKDKNIIEETKSQIRLHWNETEDVGIVTHYKGKPFTGICYDTHENGVRSQENEMVNGLKHGFGRYYDQDSNLLMESNFEDDIRNGCQKKYFKDGKLKEEANYVNNVLVGWLTAYYEDDIISYQERYDNNGLLQLVKTYKEGVPFTDLLYLSPKEGLDYISQLKQLSHKTDYYPNGKKKSEVMMKDAKPNGMYKRFHLNGKLEIEGNTINGKEEGEWKTYNQEGELLKTINYKNGVEVSKETPNNQSNFVILASIKPEDLDWVVMDMSIRKVVFTSDSHEECKKWIAN